MWTAYIHKGGYGHFFLNGKTVHAHRYAYELTVALIPDGLVPDHLCRNRGCVNPNHLEPVTRRENTLRGDTVASAESKQTHCIHNHEFTVENTYIAKSGKRQCRTCAREYERSVIRRPGDRKRIQRWNWDAAELAIAEGITA
jgi:aspartate carbamoyltransferase regulatory subunit